jgi:hypothetical protein
MYGMVKLVKAGLVTLSAAALTAGSIGVSAADSRPPAGTPATVTADALPTWQLDGVVWASVTVGNNVYVTGSFSRARPPGAKAGDPREVAAANIFAFDIRTGKPLPKFKHALNGQGLAITASPDGKAIYVGGDFTTADGDPHQHVASYSLVTGNLRKSFTARASSRVNALAATDTTLYLGGVFGGVNGASRSRLGAVTSAGKLTSWVPTADSTVQAMVVTRGRVIVGGHFTRLNGEPNYGMGAIDAATGRTGVWKANKAIRAAGEDGAIMSLAADGDRVYGSGYSYATEDSHFEGTFAADPADGSVQWVNDCHGDTYGVHPVGRVLYSVGHAHDCEWIGAFKDTSPRTFHRSLAFDTLTSGKKNKGPDDYDWDYSKYDHSNLLHWYPDLGAGSVTGQLQAAWTVTGNRSYIALGGEFPSVNGVAQSGLTRFAVSAAAPNDSGPVSTRAQLKPTATAAGGGKVTISWRATWDRDNRKLTYKVFRDGSSSPFTTLTKNSSFWQRGTMSVTDSGRKKNSKHTYRVQAVDPLGNTKMSLPSATVTVK